MELEHSFTVPVPRAQAWEVLLDVERIAPCMPGATLEHSDRDTFGGRVKVKVGPIQVVYTGKARFVERDDVAYVAVIDATGKESRGSGTVKATIRCSLHDEGTDATRVAVTTDLSITGKPAQLGRGVMADVGNKIIGQFAACLEDEITSPARAPVTAPVAVAAAVEPAVEELPAQLGTDGPAGVAAPVGTSSPSGTNLPYVPLTTPPQRSAEAIDLLDAAGLPVLKRLGPALGVLAVIVVAWRVLTSGAGRRRSRRRAGGRHPGWQV